MSPRRMISRARWLLTTLLWAAVLGACAPSAPAAVPGEVLFAVPEPVEAAPTLESALEPDPEPAPVSAAEPALLARLNWQDEFGERTIVFDTPTGTVKLRQVGAGSLMLKFGDAVVHVNPWSEVGDYSQLPQADQIWITDPLPEHLDLHAIRALSGPGTQLIVDESSAELLRGLLPFTQLRNGVVVTIDQIELTALQSFRAEMSPDGARLRPGNSYVATFGEFKLLLTGQVHFIRGLERIQDLDIALLSVDDLTSLSAEQAAELAHTLQPAAVFPYEYGGSDPAQLTKLLTGSETMVVPLNASQEAGPKPLGVPPDRTAAIAELYLDGGEPDPELLAGLFGADAEHRLLLLPDLQTLTPSRLQITYSSYTDTTLLRLTNSVWNAGYGPLELWGKVGADGASHQVVQRIFDPNEDYQERYVGQFVFHPGHNHWHLDSFALYELWSLQADGNLDQVVATSDKVSYCLRDIHRQPHPNQATYMGYGSCSYGRQGLSVGWADVYDYYLPGQSIDISGLPDGSYALMSIADPFNLIQESDETNNAVVVYLEIEGRSVRVARSPGS